MNTYKFGDIIKNFESKCLEWNKQNNNLSFVFNNDLEKIKKENVKYILIGDNPGKTEKENNRYLIGGAGISARIFFERYFVDNFSEEILVLNKTPVYSNITTSLKGVAPSILKETQEYTVNTIVKLYSVLSVPVIISGFAGCRKSKGGFLDSSSKNKDATGKYFFTELKKHRFGKDNKDLYIIKHFSRMSIFQDFTIKEYDKLNENKNFDILNAIGKKYVNELYNK